MVMPACFQPFINLLTHFKNPCHKGNALIITMAVLFLATSQLLFMGLATSSKMNEESMFTAQRMALRDAVQSAFMELESRISYALVNQANTGASPAPTITNAVIRTHFSATGNCRVSLESTVATNCLSGISGLPTNLTPLRSALSLSGIHPSTGALVWFPPLDQFMPTAKQKDAQGGITVTDVVGGIDNSVRGYTGAGNNTALKSSIEAYVLPSTSNDNTQCDNYLLEVRVIGRNIDFKTQRLSTIKTPLFVKTNTPVSGC
jgi:hypothetical protein